MLNIGIKESFLDLFYNDIECDIEDVNSKLNLRILRIENNQFCYPDLIKELSNAILTFSLSRKAFTDFEKDKRYGELYNAAIQKFRDYNVNDGEAGELLLYCFLEAHLKAPKILTKLELKTSNNDYVKGSDGIHLLRLSDSQYQLVFGESKLDAELTTSITNAFKSISDFITRDKNNIYDEIGIINSQLCKEAYDDRLYEFIKSIIFPKLNSSSPITKDNAFAIFAGFDITVSDNEAQMKNDDFRSLIRNRIKQQVEEKKAHIKKKINEYKLNGYAFYVYVFPFMKLDETRKKIIEDLTTAK